ncbi:MAG: DUF2442 domain-containing protein [Deltaproteobacteria bacterium]|nr:DUF2442 domain-containing protein [Deltaproteobacteria bacterium]
MKKHHSIENITFENDRMILTIDGTRRMFPLKAISPLLEKASEKERITLEISPSGYGIHWPLLDEDLSIDGLLGIAHSPSQQRKTA